AVNRLDDYGISNLLRERRRCFRMSDDAVASRHGRNTELRRRMDGVGLVSHQIHAFGRRSDEVDAMTSADSRKRRALGKKSNAGMQRLRSRAFGNANDAHGVQITFRGGISTDAHE